MGKKQTHNSYCKLITHPVDLRDGKVYPESVTFTCFSRMILNCSQFKVGKRSQNLLPGGKLTSMSFHDYFVLRRKIYFLCKQGF